MSPENEPIEVKNSQEVTISNNTLTFHADSLWKPEALTVLNNISESLLNLTKLLVAQKVEIKAMINVEGRQIPNESTDQS